MAETVLGGAIEFLAQIGIYEVVLPFLLVFTLMFSFLEKTKVLGMEVVKDKNGNEHSYTRKNMNALVAFTTAFFVVASSQIVRIISEVLANVIILVVAGVAFMLALGVTHTGNEEFKLEGNWKTAYWIVSGVGILIILLNALGWLDAIYGFLQRSATSSAVATVLMILVFVGFMAWLAHTPKVKESKSD